MLVAKLEIVPFGNRENARTIGEVRIGLLNENDDGVCEYLATASTTDGKGYGPALFHHRRADGAVECLRRALDSFTYPSACACGEKAVLDLTADARVNMGVDNA